MLGLIKIDLVEASLLLVFLLSASDTAHSSIVQIWEMRERKRVRANHFEAENLTHYLITFNQKHFLNLDNY